ncbi:MAG: AraC family ligand binding domain-containing protein [Dongiaceae bacterium]
MAADTTADTTDVKLFRQRDQKFEIEDGSAVLALVNAGNSPTIGAGIGIFEDCAVEWTVTYDEVLFIHDGNFRLRVGDVVYHAGAGDTLWIPAGTALVYEADARVTFFYAVFPAIKSPSAMQKIAYPTAPPQR